MLDSIREEIYLSYLDYETSERVVWLLDWPGMVVLCVSQIYWSLEVENCLVDHAVFALELLHEKLKSQILKLVDLVRGLYILYLCIISSIILRVSISSCCFPITPPVIGAQKCQMVNLSICQQGQTIISDFIPAIFF